MNHLINLLNQVVVDPDSDRTRIKAEISRALNRSMKLNEMLIAVKQHVPVGNFNSEEFQICAWRVLMDVFGGIVNSRVLWRHAITHEINSIAEEAATRVPVSFIEDFVSLPSITEAVGDIMDIRAEAGRIPRAQIPRVDWLVLYRYLVAGDGMHTIDGTVLDCKIDGVFDGFKSMVIIHRHGFKGCARGTYSNRWFINHFGNQPYV